MFKKIFNLINKKKHVKNTEVGEENLIKDDNKNLFTFIYPMLIEKSMTAIDSETGSVIIDEYLEKIHESTEKANSAAEGANAAKEAADEAAEGANAAKEAADEAAERANEIALEINTKLENGEFTGSIEIGRVETGQPGTEAKVENVGTKKDAVLNITIPRGDTGNIENIGEVTMEFEEVATRQNINSGDTFHILFGKIKKWFTDLSNGAASTLLGANLTKDRVLISNASGKISVSSITSGILEYLSGLTSNVQTQLNAKINTNKIVKSTNITSDGYLMDGKTASDALASIKNNIDAGIFSKQIAANAVTAITIPFNKTFKSVPVVVASLYSSQVADCVVIKDTTQSNVTVNVYTTAGAHTIRVHWVAIAV